MHRGGKKRRSAGKFPWNRRGLSAIVANLLIILLVLIAVGIIWVVIRNVISQGASEVEIGQFTFDVSIESAYVSGTDVIVGVRRSAGGGSDLTGMNFTFLGAGDSITIKKTGFLQEGGRRTFIFTAAEIPGIVAGDEVSVAPTYLSDGQEKVTNPTDIKTISGTAPPGGGTGGGTGGETGDPNTGFCGDIIIQSPNGDGINEQCDGTNLGATCISLGYVGGVLSCDAGCQLDTSQCTGATPASCNGTWDGIAEDSTVECDGNPLPNGCSATCVCETGFSPPNPEDGRCILDPPLDTGEIYSVWNNIYFDSINLPKNGGITGFINDYVNFSGSPEVGCFLITFADYVTETDISYLRLDDSLGAPNIAAGQNYSIWEAANCGQ